MDYIAKNQTHTYVWPIWVSLLLTTNDQSLLNTQFNVFVQLVYNCDNSSTHIGSHFGHFNTSSVKEKRSESCHMLYWVNYS